MRRVLILLMFACFGYAGDLATEVRGLRPATSRGEAVLDELQQRAESALAKIHHAQTRAEADGTREALRNQLRESLGLSLFPWPPRLEVRDAGLIERPVYRIEKLVYESLPGVLVPAHVYVPNTLRQRAPAVLFYPGHWWPDSKARPDFQAFCINMARLGFVVLTWDPFGQGERGISSRDHRRVETLPVGVAQQGIAEYETRCALEYLLTRKDVDPRRIGITGASGGGYNTWITAALDDRIAAAVPVVGTSEFAEQIRVTRPLDWYHASEHCHFVPGLIRYADNHELLAMAAPKPLMIIAASQDQSFPVVGVRRVAEYGRALYRAMGIADRIGYYEDSTEGHGYQRRKREAAYGWFLRWLMQRGDGQPYAEPATETLPYDAPELRCFAAKQAAGPGIVEFARRLERQAGSRKGSLERVLGIPPAGVSRVTLSASRVQRLEIAGEGQIALPAFLARPETPESGILFAVDDHGKEELASDPVVMHALKRGWAVCGMDPRGTGELAVAQPSWAAAVSLLLGENFVGRQSWDIRRVIKSVGASDAFRGKPKGIYARGHNSALAATYAVAAERDLNCFILRDGFLSYRQFIERPKSLAASYRLLGEDKDRTTAFDREIPFAYVPFGALRAFDLSELLSRGYGLIVDPIDGDWDRMQEPQARKLLPANVAVVIGAGAEARIREFMDRAMASR